jgi:hypothetical protein
MHHAAGAMRAYMEESGSPLFAWHAICLVKCGQTILGALPQGAALGDARTPGLPS